MPRNKKKCVFVSGNGPVEEGFEPASLHIGDVEIRPPKASSRRQTDGVRVPPPDAHACTLLSPPQHVVTQPPSDEEVDSEDSEWSTDKEADMADYLENIALNDSSAATSDQDAQVRTRML